MGLTAFIFPGQGAQYTGMGQDLYDKYPSVRRVFAVADEALGFSISELCFAGPEEKLKETAITQPAILTVSAAYLTVLQENGVTPDVAAGLSLGEYGALLAGDVLTVEEAVPLVHKRGTFMQEAVPIGVGTMAAILGLDAPLVEEACREAAGNGVVEPANYNCPGQVVIAGEVNAVERAVELCKQKGAKRAVVLPVSAPFHCSLLKPAGEKLAAELARYSFRDSKIPIFANVDAQAETDQDMIITNLIKQVSSPVRFEESIRKMIGMGVDRFIEVGPGKTLAAFVKKISKEVQVLCTDDPNDFASIIKGGGKTC